MVHLVLEPNISFLGVWPVCRQAGVTLILYQRTSCFFFILRTPFATIYT